MTRARRAAGAAHVTLLTAGALALAAAALAAPRGKTTDLIWTAPDFAARGIHSIAVLPVEAYEGGNQAQRLVTAGMGAALRGTGYRWVSSATVRDVLGSDSSGTALLARAHDATAKSVTLDSALAQQLCTRLRVQAVLATRVDLWEQRKLEWDEAGTPTTTVHVKAALVDSLGHVAWTASGSETGEGPYHDPSTNPLGMSGTSLQSQPLTNQGGPPTFEEVLSRMFARWGPQFPAHAAAPAAPSH